MTDACLSDVSITIMIALLAGAIVFVYAEYRK